MPNNKYTMKLNSRQLHSDDAFRMDSYATQYAMQNNHDKDSRSGNPYPDGDPTKVDWSKTPKHQKDEVALDQARGGTVYRRYNVPEDLAKSVGNPKLSGKRVTEDVLAAYINNSPRRVRDQYRGWFQNAQREKMQYFKENHPDVFNQMLKGKKYKIN